MQNNFASYLLLPTSLSVELVVITIDISIAFIH